MPPIATDRHSRRRAASSRYEDRRIYDPISICGHGAFGTVLQARWYGPLRLQTSNAKGHKKDGTLVAIKKLKVAVPSHISMRGMLDLPELRALLAIPPHRNVVALWDVFLLRPPAPRKLHLVFEYLPSNLVQLIECAKEAKQLLPPTLVVSIARQLLQGIAHIHQSGWMHRDLKPENVLITHEGSTLDGLLSESSYAARAVIKVADLGLARQLCAPGPLTTYVSTRWYRSPELLLDSENYGPGADNWAAGVLLAECLRLTPLFPGKDQVDQFKNITHVLGRPPLRGYGEWSQGLVLARRAKVSWPRNGVGLDNLLPQGSPRSVVFLIKKLLTYNPVYRLESQEALRLRLFEQCKSPIPFNRKDNLLALPETSSGRDEDMMEFYDRELAHQLKTLYCGPSGKRAHHAHHTR